MKTAEYINSFGEVVEIYEGDNGHATVVDGVITVYDRHGEPIGSVEDLDELHTAINH